MKVYKKITLSFGSVTSSPLLAVASYSPELICPKTSVSGLHSEQTLNVQHSPDEPGRRNAALDSISRDIVCWQYQLFK